MKRSSSQFTLAALSLVCILMLVGCCSTNIPVLRYITISPQSALGTVGGSVTFTALAYYSDGSIQNGTNLVTWGSTNPAVATVTLGVATPVSNGTTTITATAMGTPGASAVLTVNTLVMITVTPKNPTVPAGNSQQFDAMGTFSDGSMSDVTTLAYWSSSNLNAATIGASTGLAAVPATATSGAFTTIAAFLYGINGTTTLTVGAATPVPVSLTITTTTPKIAIGNTATYVATENWSDGTTGHAPGATVTWTSSSTATATILANVSSTNAASAAALGLVAGTSTITASEGALTPGTATLTVVTGSTHYAYVSNSGSGTIEWYTVTAGTSPYLTAPANNTLNAPKGPPTQTVVYPSGAYVYFTDTTNAVYASTVDTSTGALSLPTGTPVTGGAFSQPFGVSGDTTFVVIDPFGRFLYASDDGGGEGGGTISGWTINSDGSLTAISGSPFNANVDSPECLIIDRTGTYLYATNIAGNTISAYTINPTTGALTALSTPTFATGGTGPQLATLDPSGTHLYLADSTSNQIEGFTIGSGGTLTSLGTPTTPTPAPTTLINVVVDPSDTHIYALDAGVTNGQVYGFNLNSTGTIGSAISGMPIPAGNSPVAGIVIDPTGVLMAVENNFPNASNQYTISLYTIGTGGKLTSDTPVQTESGPLFVTFYNAP